MLLNRRNFALSLAALAVGSTPALAQYDSTAYDDAELAVLSAAKTARTVAGLRHVSGVSVINMRFRAFASVPFEFDRSPQQLGITVDRHMGEVNRLRSALRNNRATAAALAARGIAVSRVAGARVSSGGWLTVYLI